jgi:hypothetical protein
MYRYYTWQRGLVSKGVLEHTLGMQRPQYLKYDIKDILIVKLILGNFSGDEKLRGKVQYSFIL